MTAMEAAPGDPQLATRWPALGRPSSWSSPGYRAILRSRAESSLRDRSPLLPAFPSGSPDPRPARPARPHFVGGRYRERRPRSDPPGAFWSTSPPTGPGGHPARRPARCPSRPWRAWTRPWRACRHRPGGAAGRRSRWGGPAACEGRTLWAWGKTGGQTLLGRPSAMSSSRLLHSALVLGRQRPVGRAEDQLDALPVVLPAEAPRRLEPVGHRRQPSLP